MFAIKTNGTLSVVINNTYIIHTNINTHIYILYLLGRTLKNTFLILSGQYTSEMFAMKTNSTLLVVTNNAQIIHANKYTHIYILHLLGRN